MQIFRLYLDANPSVRGLTYRNFVKSPPSDLRDFWNNRPPSKRPSTSKEIEGAFLCTTSGALFNHSRTIFHCCHHKTHEMYQIRSSAWLWRLRRTDRITLGSDSCSRCEQQENCIECIHLKYEWFRTDILRHMTELSKSNSVYRRCIVCLKQIEGW